MFGVICCKFDCNSGGGTLNCFNGRSRGFGDGDGVKLKRTLGVVRFLFRLGWIICISMVDIWFCF